MAAFGPLILLSPAKSLNFESALTSAIASCKPTQARFPEQAAELTAALAKLSKPQIKSLMGLSDNLAALNFERFSQFEAQDARMAIGAFEGMAYKGLEAPTLATGQLDYLQSNLRILCGLYGVLRPYDEIRPYRLEMSTKLAVGDAATLYKFWGDSLTTSLEEELVSRPGSWLLNCASQEYAKAVSFDAITAPVVTASFPGPAVHAKQARGEITRFCAEQKVSKPDELKAFKGSAGMWSYVEDASDESTYVFKRGAATPKTAAPTKAKGSKRKERA